MTKAPSYITDTNGREQFCVRKYGIRESVTARKKRPALAETKLERSFLPKIWTSGGARRVPNAGSITGPVYFPCAEKARHLKG